MVSLTVIKDVQIPGSPISSVTKPAMFCPVVLMLVTVDKVPIDRDIAIKHKE